MRVVETYVVKLPDTSYDSLMYKTEQGEYFLQNQYGITWILSSEAQKLIV